MRERHPVGAILRDRGISQRWLARKLGIHESLLSRYLAGDRPMPQEITQTVAALLSVPVENIATEEALPATA